jgi:hypothetical protein
MDAIGILSGVPALTVTAVTLALGTIMFIIAVGLLRQRINGGAEAAAAAGSPTPRLRLVDQKKSTQVVVK